MVTGRVIAHGKTLQPVVEVIVHGSSNQRARVQAVVDTGFTQYLTLPAHAIAALNLQFAFEEKLTMANGESININAYTALMEWGGRTRQVEIHSAEGDPLTGMAMLRDHDLYIRAVPDGTVRIDPVA